MPKNINLLVITVLLLLVFLTACQSDGATGGAAQATPLPAVTQASGSVSAEAFVAPAGEVSLAFEAGGRVVTLAVAEGDTVAAGQALAQLSDTDVLLAIAQAEAGLAQAEASLALAKLGPMAEQIAQAEAGVIQAQAALAQAVAGPRPEDVAVAQARVNTLQTQLSQVLAGSNPEAVTAALAGLRQAENALELAQADYDRIAYAADSEFAQPIALALENATINYQTAKANYEAALRGATPQQIAIARSQVIEGQAGLNQLLAGPSPEQIAIAQAGVIQAEAVLNLAKSGPRAEQIAVAAAAVKPAQVGVDQAKAALAKLSLTASQAGLVSRIEVKAGEMVSPGVPVIHLADISTWQIETDDLTEIDVVKVQPGQAVKIIFDAFPDQEFAGTVERIKPRSETKAGDVTYTVVITFNETPDIQLRWGMTTFVEIDTE